MPNISNIDHTSPTDYVLHLITNKAMTSRDIQITLKKSREHTSRLMKKLFEDGYVERNTETKPYTYSITEKGKTKVEEIQSNPMTSHKKFSGFFKILYNLCYFIQISGEIIRLLIINYII